MSSSAVSQTITLTSNSCSIMAALTSSTTSSVNQTTLRQLKASRQIKRMKMMMTSRSAMMTEKMIRISISIIKVWSRVMTKHATTRVKQRRKSSTMTPITLKKSISSHLMNSTLRLTSKCLQMAKVRPRRSFVRGRPSIQDYSGVLV